MWNINSDLEEGTQNFEGAFHGEVVHELFSNFLIQKAGNWGNLEHSDIT